MTLARHSDSANRTRPRGTVLVAMMWIVLVLAGLVVVFARSMRVEAIASANRVASLQASAIAKGALQYVIAGLEGSRGTMPSETDLPCEAVQIGDGYFWILRVDTESEVDHSFGLTSEASKLSLNRADIDMLLKLPEMTDELAGAIEEWRDETGTAPPSGAGDEYYMLLPEPYQCKHGPFDSVEELLLVKGCTPQVLYGEDANMNGVLDPNENDGDENEPTDNTDGHLDHGLAEFVTVYSVEPNTDSTGQARVNVNGRTRNALTNLLQQSLSAERDRQVAQLAGAGQPFRNALDFYFRTGLTSSEFALIADRITTTGGSAVLRGLIDVNHAPRQVLMCLPGLTEGDADAMIAKRATADPAAGIAWVVEALPREKAIPIGDYITTRAFQFTADIVAVSGNGRAYKRYRAVIDTRVSPPRVLRWQDVTRLGWPLSPDILQTLRSGQELSNTATASLTTPAAASKGVK